MTGLPLRFRFRLLKIALVASLFPVLAVAQQTGNIPLSGSVGQNCTISVTPTAAASSLDLSDGAKRVLIGGILQNCNKKAGYRITVDTDNCSTGTPGAKLIGAIAPADTLNFSVEFANETTGGSQASVTGLLSTQCSGDAYILGRSTTGSKIVNETSDVYANYTGDSSLAADTYTDTLRITMTVN